MIKRIPHVGVFLYLTSVALHAEPMSLDRTFGIDGKVTTLIEDKNSAAFAVLIQPDGKIVAGGFVWDPGSKKEDFLLIRYLPNGERDFSFGMRGIVRTDLGGESGKPERIHGLLLQENGKILAVGSTYNNIPNRKTGYNIALARYTDEGSLDQSFGSDGKITLASSENIDEEPLAMVAQDKHVVIVGRRGDKAAIWRADSQGNVDVSFATAGVNALSLPNSVFYAVDVQGDGYIVAAGACPNSDRGEQWLVARFDSDGALDSSQFGSSGLVLGEPLQLFGQARAIRVQVDGKMVVAGKKASSLIDSDFNFGLARFTSFGARDSHTFGSAGAIDTDMGSFNDSVYGLEIQNIHEEWRIVSVGVGGIGTSLAFAVARHTEDGRPDTKFIFQLGSENASSAYAVAVQTDWKLVIVGSQKTEGQTGFGLVRIVP